MSLRSKRSTSGRSRVPYDSVAVRVAGPEDAEAIRRVAVLDGKRAPIGYVLVAEADGEVIAALAADGSGAVADPFRWTSDVMALMEMRAAQLHRSAPGAVAGAGAQGRRVHALRVI